MADDVPNGWWLAPDGRRYPPPPPPIPFPPPPPRPPTPTRRASRRDLRTVLILDLVALVAAVWGAVVMFTSTYWNGEPGSTLESSCDANGYAVPFPPVVLPWLIIAVCAFGNLILWQARGRGDGRVAASAVVCSVVAVITCPLVLMVLNGLSCGM